MLDYFLYKLPDSHKDSTPHLQAPGLKTARKVLHGNLKALYKKFYVLVSWYSNIP
jgi:hypothetical protein